MMGWSKPPGRKPDKKGDQPSQPKPRDAGGAPQENGDSDDPWEAGDIATPRRDPPYEDGI